MFGKKEEFDPLKELEKRILEVTGDMSYIID